MIKLIPTILLVLLAVSAQAQQFSLGMVDAINLQSRPEATFLVEADDASFFRISGVYSASSVHALLTDIDPDYKSLYFLKYNSSGEALFASHIQGADKPGYAASFEGGLVIFANADEELVAGDQFLANPNAYNTEFLASYDANGELVNLKGLWGQKEHVYYHSDVVMDEHDGGLYVYGDANMPLDLQGWGLLGGDLATPYSYFYVIKYSKNLELQWVYTAGFDPDQSGISPSYNNLRVFPGNYGEILICGNYGSDCSPLIGEQSLPSFQDATGTFALKLDAKGEEEWTMDGNLGNQSSYSQIFEAFPMENGGFVLLGNTTTGSFSLGEMQVNIPGGNQFSNQFACRIEAGGKLSWQRIFMSMGLSPEGGKKTTSSELFEQSIACKALSWNKERLYLASSFQPGYGFAIAGASLAGLNPAGLYLAALDMASGSELWGYGLTSDATELYGMDVDEYGRVSLLGSNLSTQSLQGIGSTEELAGHFLVQLSIDDQGKLLSYNNLIMDNGPDYDKLSASDLLVLPHGEVFSAIQFNEANAVNINGDFLANDYPYSSQLVNLGPLVDISGLVTFLGEAPITTGSVKVIRRMSTGVFPVVASVDIDENGRFFFDQLPPGPYSLMAVPPEDSDFYYRTYLGNTLSWQDALFFDVELAFQDNTLDIDVKMKETMVGPGEYASLQGGVSYHENWTGSFLKSTMGQPVKKKAVILYRKSKKSTTDDIVRFTETNGEGIYSFGWISPGTYTITIDVAGLSMIDERIIVVDSTEAIEGLDYIVGNHGIYVTPSVGTEMIEDLELKVYPNPGNGLIVLTLEKPGEYISELYTPDGRLLRKDKLSSQGEQLFLDISREAAGLYILRLLGEGGMYTTRYIKQ